MAIEARNLPRLSTSTVSVYRQQDIASEIANAINKARGAAVVIVWDGFSRPEEVDRVLGPQVLSSYKLQLFFAPVLKPGGITIDEIAEDLVRHFDNWTPTNTPTDAAMRMWFRTADLSPEDGWLLYELNFDIRIQFTPT